MRLSTKSSIISCIAALTTLSTTVARADLFAAGDLVVSRSVYMGTSSTVTVGQALPGGGNAVADGAYPEVFQNATVDASFGVTSPIFIDDVHVSGATATVVNTLAVPSTKIVTSFSSKSEMALNLSTNGKYFTFMGYVSPINTLDVSNANTPNHVDPTNPVYLNAAADGGTVTYQRAVAQIDSQGNVQVTDVNTYSGTMAVPSFSTTSITHGRSTHPTRSGRHRKRHVCGRWIRVANPAQDPLSFDYSDPTNFFDAGSDTTRPYGICISWVDNEQLPGKYWFNGGCAYDSNGN